MWERKWRESQNTKAKDTVAVNTIETEDNAPLAYAPGLEHQHPTMGKLVGNGVQLERDRDPMS